MSRHSAGILLYRYREGTLQVLLAHPGGPFWVNKDRGAWSIPKGLVDPEEAELDAARREFAEETGFEVEGEFTSLGRLKQPSGKVVHAWALESDLDAERIESNTFEMEWPKKSGTVRAFPEIDRAAWFDVDEAREGILEGQAPFLDRLLEALEE